MQDGYETIDENSLICLVYIDNDKSVSYPKRPGSWLMPLTGVPIKWGRDDRSEYIIGSVTVSGLKSVMNEINGSNVKVIPIAFKELTGKVIIREIYSADLLTGEVDVNLVKAAITGSTNVICPIIKEITGTVTNPAVQKFITGSIKIDAGNTAFINGEINIIGMKNVEITGVVRNFLEFSDFLLTGTVDVNKLYKDMNGTVNVDNSDESYFESENSYSDPDMIKRIAEW